MDEGTITSGQALAINTNGASTAVLALGTLTETTFSLENVTTTAFTYGSSTGTALGSDDKFTVTLANGGSIFTGSSIADSVTGGSGADSITGGAGADSITGGAAADTITGGNGDDSITGGDGADSLTGGAGDDTITLGTGSSAGADIDTVVFASTGALNGSDTVNEFAVAQDKFNITAFLTGATHVSGTASTATALADHGNSIAVANNKVLFAAGHATATTGFDTAAKIVTGIADGGDFDAIDVAASAKAILVFGAVGTGTTMYVYAVENDGTAAIATGEVTLIGTINGAAADIGTISIATNFVVA